MTLILLSQTMFGNLVAIRILRRFRHRALISTASLTKIGIAFALALSAGVLFSFSRAREPLIFIIAAPLLLQTILKIQERRRIERLYAYFPRFLDRWLLNLRMGLAGSAAREKALSGADEQFRALIAPLFEGARRPGERHLFLSVREVCELKAAQLEPHSTVSRLQNLRKGVARAANFRRKSGQALRQAAVQSALLLLMHIALCFFTVARGDAAANLDLIAGASLLTVSGVLVLRLMARRIRWTI